MKNRRFRNPGVVAAGMLAPSGYYETYPDASVQSTTRPAGTLLVESPGYDSIRPGKNRFQGKGPTGGFRPMEFAEDVGGGGAALAVTPGDTTQIEASEWLPEDPDSIAGSMVISDRKHRPGYATRLHEGLDTLADMGDRDPDRPLSKSRWLHNPVTMYRADLKESPAITVGATIGLVVLIHILATDAERQYRAYRGGGGGPVREVANVPAAAASGGGEAVGDAVTKIGDAADKAVNRIEQATDSAVDKISNTVKSATSED